MRAPCPQGAAPRPALLLQLVGLLCLAAAAPARAAAAQPAGRGASAADGPAPPRRALLQTADECASHVPNCVACRFQTYRGTTTRAICFRCREGYVARESGRACWCAPGYYQTDSGSCESCGEDFYCPGAKSTPMSAVARYPCGDNKKSHSTLATSDRDCVAERGYNWGPGDSSKPCPQGSFNPGGAARRCTPCAGGLTTEAEGASSQAECVAPPGFTAVQKAAVPCPQGTYKPGFGNAECTRCPDGWTTEPGQLARTAAKDCAYALAGYSAPAGQLSLLGVSAAAAPCAPDSYRADPALYDAAADAAGLPCTPCPDGFKAAAAGATSADACLAAPGTGLLPNGTAAGLLPNGTAAGPCPRGTYSTGVNRSECTPCGPGAWETEGEGAASADACYVPAGYSAHARPDGAIEAFICPAGTYGRERATYGRAAIDCLQCPDGTTTAAPGASSPLHCVTLPGHGWSGGAAEQCAFAYYSPGGAQEPCQYCGEGYNTTDAAAGSVTDCVIAAGWASDGAGGVKPCMQGFYKAALGDSPCLRCPAGTTTTLTLAPAALSACDACQPGFGAARIDAAAPACAPCPSGTFSFGRVQGGAPCQECPRPAGYTGRMVSRLGLESADGCYPEFSDTGAPESLHWDFIPMAGPGVLSEAGGNATASDCQALCAAAPGCQYFTHTDNAGAGGVCRIRDRGVAPADTAAPGAHIAFEISSGVYVVYGADPSDWASTGKDLATFPSRAAATASCDATPACAGFKSNADATQWRTFQGSMQARVTSKVRAAGEAINTWLPPPGAD